MRDVNIGPKIRQLRLQAGMTQVEFASRIGVTNITVSKWENDRQTPHQTRMAELERVLGAHPGDRTQNHAMLHSTRDWMSQARVTAVVTGVAVSLKAGVPMPGVCSAEIETIPPLRHTAIDGAGPGAGLGVELPDDAPGDSGDKATVSAKYVLHESNELDRHGANSPVARRARGEIGELIDFDPHDPGEHPALSGVYVLYDISERPLYVGQGKAIDKRTVIIMTSSGSGPRSSNQPPMFRLTTRC